MYKILIVEDDDSMAFAMKKKIESWGNEVKLTEDFSKVLETFTEFEPDLVLLDIMLPFFNGYHWCSEIRRISQVPVIFLSSASDNMNVVMAVNMGGDDFIAKPVDLDVLMAKITAMLRRTYGMSAATATLHHAGAVLNLGDNTISFEEKTAELTKNEFKILQTLMEQKGKIVSRDTLMMRLWQMDEYVEENTLTVNVNRLRKKLEAIGLKDFIATKVGSGYLIEKE